MVKVITALLRAAARRPCENYVLRGKFISLKNQAVKPSGWYENENRAKTAYITLPLKPSARTNIDLYNVHAHKSSIGYPRRFID